LKPAAVVLALACVACGASRPPPVIPQPLAEAVPQHPVTRPSDDEPEPAPPAVLVPVLEQRTESSPLVTIRVAFHSGSADDPHGREGATNLAARVMVEGGTEAMTYEQLTRAMFPMAAHIAFDVDRDETVFVAQVHRDHLAAFYPIFRDVILHPRMAEADFRRLRELTLSDLTQDLRGANDEDLGREYLQALVYSDHPYGHPALGTERGLATLDFEALRAHRTSVFCRARVLAGVAGGYPETFAARLRADLGQLPASCPAAVALPTPVRPRGMHVSIIDRAAANSVAISIGFPITITRRDADFPAVQFVTNYFGMHRQSSGVLYQLIREARGLNYGDYAYAEHFDQEGGSRFSRPNVQRRQQYASIWIRPVAPIHAHFALRAAMRALTRMLQNGIPAVEFERTRTFLSGYVNLFLQNESTRLGFSLDDVWNELIPADGGTGIPGTSSAGAAHPTGSYAEYPLRMRSAWTALVPDATMATARRHLTADDVWVAIVAPNAQSLATAIGANTPSPIRYDTPKPASVVAEDREISAFRLNVRPADVHVVPLADVFH